MNRGGNPGPAEGEEWIVSKVGMRLVYVAPGSYVMGSRGLLMGILLAGTKDEEKPAHRVTISRGFWIGKYEVTHTEYEAIIGTNPNPTYLRGDRYPVTCVSWTDAMTFCRNLTAAERVRDEVPAGYQYRLPSEAEWEFAARGGPYSKGYIYSGSNRLDEVAWYQGTSNHEMTIHPVGQKKSNELGLYDMSGNVWEWCYDCYGNYAEHCVANMKDPMGSASGLYRVRRGGEWGSDACDCRVARRGAQDRGYTDGGLGFRVALAPVLPDPEPEVVELPPAPDYEADAAAQWDAFMAVPDAERRSYTEGIEQHEDFDGKQLLPGSEIRSTTQDGRTVQGKAVGATDTLIAVRTPDGLEWVYAVDPETNMPFTIL